MRRACRVALQLRLSSTSTVSVAGPSRSKVDQQQRTTVSTAMTTDDEKLIQRGEFYGVVSLNEKKWNSKSPELALTRTYDHLNRNFRVSAEAVMNDLILKLEQGDAALLSLLRRDPERWIPMSIRCCGRALSSIPLESRRVVASRLWKQIGANKLPVSIESMNALLRVNLDNDKKWNPWEILKKIEEKGLVADQMTFHLLLEKFSLAGDVEECTKMLDEMVGRGYSSDAITHSHLVYANALKGYNHTVNSMLEQAVANFGAKGETLSLGAACVAAAATGNIDRLREVLRRSVDDNLRLCLSYESVFEIIWKLSEQGGKTSNETMIMEILNRTHHPTGFFRFLYREIERHIAASNFHTAVVLLEETNRVKDPLKNQERTAYAEQMVARMCRAMIKSRMDERAVMRIANRMETSLRMRSRFIHDELMMSALTLKEFDSDERFSAFTSLLPAVDPKRERSHIILPLIAFTPNVENRLKLIFRATSLGYSNLEMLNTYVMEKHIFQPMYNRQRWYLKQRPPGVRDSPLDKMTSILNSFGLPKATVWHMMNDWWKTRRKREKEEWNSTLEMRERPYPEELQKWLRSSYNSSFNNSVATPTNPLTKTELAEAIKNRNSSEILSLLSTRGWPQEVDLTSTAHKILDQLLENESSEKIMEWLNQLSREVAIRQNGKGKEMMKSLLNSSHILRVLLHRMQESRLSSAEVIDMAYELKRLFPHAIINEECINDVVPYTKKLLRTCFPYNDGPTSNPLKTEDLDDFIDLMRQLIKLELAFLSPHSELVTPFCINKMINAFGWDEAVTLWQRFVSTFSLGNGLAVLLSEACRPSAEESEMKQRIQFVKHKAEAALSSSRIHAIYAAVLTNTGSIYSPGLLEEEAVEYFKEHGSAMTPFDCMAAYRLVNGVRYPQTEQYFIRNFPALCLAHTPLAQDNGEARRMLQSALKFCEAKRVGPLILEIRDVFAQYGVKTDAEDERRIERTMEDHERSVQEWIYSPGSFIQAEVGQEFLKKDEWKKFVKPKEEIIEDNCARLQ